MTIPTKVKVVEVGPRDGLQSEQQILDVNTRVTFIDLLTKAALPVIEVGSFVSPKWVPQMADSALVYQAIKQSRQTAYPMLVPNLEGLDYALEAGVQEIAVFASASETFSQNNINCSIAESIKRFTQVIQKAKQNSLKVRAYISCVLGCPYEGTIEQTVVAELASSLYKLGCYEISLGDTIGVGTPVKTEKLLGAVAQSIPIEQVAVHFHDTYGQALANCLTALHCGVQIFDTSVAGLGGCPYAKGASGNLATEDLLYMLRGMNIDTGVDFAALIKASDYICSHLHHLPRSKAALALSQQYRNSAKVD